MRAFADARPTVAIVAHDAGAETVDLLAPFAVLAESGVADVVVVSPRGGTVPLMPALRLGSVTSFAAFDAAHPSGADLVIVPALHASEAPEMLAWLDAQAAHRAKVAGICDGAKTVAAAGLLAGHTATAHWYAIEGLERGYRDVRWVRDRRWVDDGPVMTTAGVTAAVPASLHVVATIGDEAVMRATARRLGMPPPSDAHDTAPFHLTFARVGTLLGNLLLPWRHETIAVPVTDGIDELALALTADAWSRTYRSQVVTTGSAPTVRTHHGLTLVVDRPGGGPVGDAVVTVGDGPPGGALDRALEGIDARYGRATADLVALQLEYAWPAAP
jgi:putative intracellular protease/amidase